MVLTGVLEPTELYSSVDWNVIFLLAGVIPLGIALQETGAAALIGEAVASTTTVLPAIGVLWVLYLVTGVLMGVISNNASVVLMIPVAASAAQGIGANAFAFVLAVTFTGLDGVHDARGVSDEPLRLRARWIHIRRLSPRRGAAAVHPVDRYRSRDRVLLGVGV